MRHRRFAVACWIGLAGACVDTADTERVSTVASDILDGAPWNPWTHSTQTWTQNVVLLDGCTGTLLDYEWVMTASHCYPDSTVDPSTLDVWHTLADGTVEYSAAAELLYHPKSGILTNDEANNVDAVLLRLAQPMHPGQATLPLYQGTMPNLEDKSVFCAGYGAIDTGKACTTSSQCSGAEWCQWGVCMTPDDDRLRTATFTTMADPTNPAIWIAFDVPNSQGQIELPGDSGSSCWDGSGLTSIDKGGSTTRMHHTGAPAFRDWMEGQATPTVLTEVNRAGARCRATGTGTSSYTDAGRIENDSASTINVVCPIDRPIQPTASNFVRAPKLWVFDHSDVDDVCCHLESKNPGSGTPIVGSSSCTTGNQSGYQELTLSSVKDGATFSEFDIVCNLPATTISGASGIDGYRVQLTNR